MMTNGCMAGFLNRYLYRRSSPFRYNVVVRIHQTLRIPPAIAAGAMHRLLSIEDIAGLLD